MTTHTRYSVTAPLDDGSRGFRGTAVSSDGVTREVAITPVVPNLIANERFAAMLLADLRSSLRLSHANVIEVLDICRIPERAYVVVTQLVDGCTLAALVAHHQRVTVALALHIVVECCKGLAHAHSLDVTHRDLRPSNVLVSTTGDVKLAGFGLARANAQIDREGQFSYLSPEAANGQPVDHRADVFAAGIVLWELLAHRRLFLGQTDYATVVLVREARFEPVDDVDPALAAIARRALARDVHDRYQSAAELAEALGEHAVVSASETASMVREAQLRHAIDARELARIQADVSRMISIATDDDG